MSELGLQRGDGWVPDSLSVLGQRTRGSCLCGQGVLCSNNDVHVLYVPPLNRLAWLVGRGDIFVRASHGSLLKFYDDDLLQSLCLTEGFYSRIVGLP